MYATSKEVFCIQQYAVRGELAAVLWSGAASAASHLDRSLLRVGDIILSDADNDTNATIDHAAMYVGDDQVVSMWDFPSDSYSNDAVKMMSVDTYDDVERVYIYRATYAFYNEPLEAAAWIKTKVGEGGYCGCEKFSRAGWWGNAELVWRAYLTVGINIDPENDNCLNPKDFPRSINLHEVTSQEGPVVDLDFAFFVDQAGLITYLEQRPNRNLRYRNLNNPHNDWGWTLTSNQTWDKPLGVGDFNKDGWNDYYNINGDGAIYAILQHPNSSPERVWLGNPHTQWGWGLTSQQTGDKPVGVGDVDGDGVADIVVINGNGEIKAVRPQANWTIATNYFGCPNRDFGWSQQPNSCPFDSQSTCQKPLGLVDVNGDGRADIVLVNRGGAITVTLTPPPGDVYKNTSWQPSPIGSPTYEAGNPHTSWGWTLTSQQTWDIPIGMGDVNRDGTGDIIIVNGNGDVNAILFHPNRDSTGRFVGCGITAQYLGNASSWGITSDYGPKAPLSAGGFDWWW